MAKIATRDTYAIERMSDGIEVRRVVKAGDVIPAHYDVEADAVRETNHPVVLNATRSEESAKAPVAAAEERATGRRQRSSGSEGS